MELLTTERLVLRNFTEEDLESLLDYRNDERCFRWQRGQFRQAEPLLNLIRSSSADDLKHDGKKHLAIARKEDNLLVGDLFLSLAAPTITLGYTISYHFHRQGFAFELLSALTERLHQLYPQRETVCCVEQENAASIALLQKLGFDSEGYSAAIDSLIFSRYTQKTNVDSRKESTLFFSFLPLIKAFDERIFFCHHHQKSDFSKAVLHPVNLRAVMRAAKEQLSSCVQIQGKIF